MAKKKFSLAKSAAELRESRATSSTKYCEYAVHKDKTFLTYLGKIGAVLGPIVAIVAAIILLGELLPKGGGAAIVGVVGGIVFGSIGCYFIFVLMRFTNLDYEYVLCDGQMEMIKVYGGSVRKPVFRKKINEMDIIAPANGEWAEQYKDYLDESKYKTVLRCCSSMKTKDLYFAAFDHEKLGRTLVYFNAIKKSVDIFRYHTTKTIVKPGIL